MNNKKAIDLLNMIEFENAECNLGTWYHGIDGDMKEALDMAIQALEQEPCDKYIKEIDHLRKYIVKLETQIVEQEPCEDAISRTEVLDLIDSKDPNYEVRHFKEDVECLPPVTPQQRIGKWIKSRDSYGNNHFTCPFCEHDIATKYAGTWDDNYCSNCGARLEVEE